MHPLDKDVMNTNELSGNRKALFWKRTLIMFVFLVVILGAFGFGPTPVREFNNKILSFLINDRDVKNAEEIVQSGVTAYAEPTRIVIPAIGTDSKVLNPVNADNKTLDAALLLGAVRYPSSGDLESDRTVLLFGHSSYLPVVNNPAYKSFNDIQKLKVGDVIMIYSSNKKYTYKVEKTEKIVADEGFINLSEANHKLVLATCNVFGKKEDRFVVTAGFVESSAAVN